MSVERVETSYGVVEVCVYGDMVVMDPHCSPEELAADLYQSRPAAREAGRIVVAALTDSDH